MQDPDLRSYIDRLYPKDFYPADYLDSQAWGTLCEKISSIYATYSAETIEIKKVRMLDSDACFYINEKSVDVEYMRAELYISGELYMSITPMEVQAHINPILWASGNILVAGLGLGYYLYIVTEKPEVKMITVIEKNPEIIRWYKEKFQFSDKIRFICGDIFKERIQDSFDFVYVDIWPNFLIDEIETDMQLIMKRIQSKLYAFWGIELYTHDQIKVFGDVVPPLLKLMGFNGSHNLKKNQNQNQKNTADGADLAKENALEDIKKFIAFTQSIK